MLKSFKTGLMVAVLLSVMALGGFSVY